MLIFAAILGPMTAFLVWLIICELRGVPALPDLPTPPGGQLDTLGRWILGGVCIALAALAYVSGGIVGLIAIATVFATLATFISFVWTFGQSAAHLIRRRRARRAGLPALQALSPIHQRFAVNFRRTIVQLPLYLVTYW